jgi:tripartite-type tricarboxylate transporter receptor subunit TctC
MRAVGVACFLAVAAASPGAAHAQDYPASPVRFIVPFSAGGGTDLVARVTGRKLAEKWGQSVVIENRPGGDGAIGLEAAARAAPDGHTMVMILTAHAVLPSVKSKVGYNLLQDFAPVMNMVEFPNVLLAHPGVPVGNVRELIALARSRPGQLNFAGAGIGGHAHLAGELFNSLAGIRMTYISYKGTAPALVELLGGHVDLMFAAMGSVLPHVRSAKLRPLAITSAQRSATLPALPTVDESGLKGYEFVGWYGVGVPAGTPQGLVTKLEAAFRSVLADPEVLKVLGDAGGNMVGSGPGPFGAYMKAELAKYAQVVAKAKIKAE